MWDCELGADEVPIYRIKLQPKGATFQDFVINEETKNGFPGFINLLGIESPGTLCALKFSLVLLFKKFPKD